MATTRKVLASMVVLLGLVLVACTSEASSGNGQPKTGIASVDAAIEAVAARDAARLAGQAVFRDERCSTERSVTTPECRPGEANGTAVKVIWGASCEGFHIRSTDLEATLDRYLEAGPELYVVYRHNGLIFPSSPYVVVFEGEFDPPASYGGSQLFLSDEGLVGVNFGCGQPAKELVDFLSLDDAIVKPRS